MNFEAFDLVMPEDKEPLPKPAQEAQAVQVVPEVMDPGEPMSALFLSGTIAAVGSIVIYRIFKGIKEHKLALASEAKQETIL